MWQGAALRRLQSSGAARSAVPLPRLGQGASSHPQFYSFIYLKNPVKLIINLTRGTVQGIKVALFPRPYFWLPPCAP
jgi:hypothetical protein